MLKALFCYPVFAFMKSLKQSILRLTPKPLFAFFQGYFMFLTDISTVAEKRKEIQSKRIIKEGVFLKITPPKH